MSNDKQIKLPTEVVDLLLDATDVSALLGTDNIILDGHSIRGEAQKSTFFVMPFGEIIDWEFGGIGITRPQDFSKRMNLIRDLGGSYEILADIKSREDHSFVSTLHIKSGRTKISFKCGDHTRMLAPKGMGNPATVEFTLTKKDIDFISKADSVMGAELMNISVDAESDVTITVLSKDKSENVAHTLNEKADIVGTMSTIDKTYKTKTLVTAIKSLSRFLKKENIDDLTLTLTERGVAKMEVKGMNAHVFPES